MADIPSKQSDSAYFPTHDDPLAQIHASEKLDTKDNIITALLIMLIRQEDPVLADILEAKRMRLRPEGMPAAMEGARLALLEAHTVARITLAAREVELSERT